MGAAQDPDFIVVGSGVAGLRAAIDLAAAGSVLILAKDDPWESVTHHAHDSIRVPLGEEEDLSLHLQETLRSGDGLCREEAVRILVEEGQRQIRQLSEWGARFESASGGAALPSPGGRGRPRVLRSPGDSIGQEILRTLNAKIKSLCSLRLKLRAMVVDLLVDQPRVCGVMYLDEESGAFKRVRGAAVLMATGGLGQVYAETTNPPGACGDGVAAAFRAGAMLSDMEFIQFHPTVLCTQKAPRFVLPLALCEHGAHLRNLELERFMFRYHEAGERAPSDVISRSILTEMQRLGHEFIYLDLTSLNREHVKQRFPQICAACLQNNIDITSDLTPARPAAHFAIGGIATNLEGATTLKGLYAVGEVAATGVHGANRLANNPLLEGLVYGARAASAMIAGRDNAEFSLRSSSSGLKHLESEPSYASSGPTDLETVAGEIRHLMWNNVGLIRHGSKLKEAASRLSAITLSRPPRPNRQYYEVENLLEIARLITCCAAARKESRGAHYRADFPLRNDSSPAQHSFISKHSAVYFM